MIKKQVERNTNFKASFPLTPEVFIKAETNRVTTTRRYRKLEIFQSSWKLTNEENKDLEFLMKINFIKKKKKKKTSDPATTADPATTDPMIVNKNPGKKQRKRIEAAKKKEKNETFGKNPGKKQRKRIEAAIAKAQRVATEN